MRPAQQGTTQAIDLKCPQLPWQATHVLLAQRVRLLGRSGDGYLVEHEDGSVGWVKGWPHNAVMVPIAIAEREALND